MAPISSSEDKKKRLWLLVYASSSLQLVERLSQCVLAKNYDDKSAEHYSLVVAIFTIYGRLFHKCFGVGCLSERDLPADCLPFHRALLIFRDKVYAHKDITGVSLEEQTANEVRFVLNNGNVHFFSTELYHRPPGIPAIIPHAQKIQAHFSPEIGTLIANLTTLCNGLTNGEYVLNLGDDTLEPFIRVKHEDRYT